MSRKRMDWSHDGTIAWTTHDSGLTRALLTDAQRATIDSDDGEEWTGGSIPDSTNQAGWIMFDFGAQVIIDQIGLAWNYSNDMIVEVSSDSDNGVNGGWTEVMVQTPTVAGYRATYFNLTTPTAGKWMRMRLLGTVASWSHIYRVILFGEYISPEFQLYDETGTILHTAQTPLVFPDAESIGPYDESLSFKIKNTSASISTYNIEVFATSYAGDAFITTYFNVAPSSIVDLAINGFSPPIVVTGTFTGAQNPTDGKHYLKVRVTEVQA